MHLTARYYDYYQSSAYIQYVQRRNIILGVSLTISILLFLFSLHRYLKKRRERKAAQLGTQTNNVQSNGANLDKIHLILIILLTIISRINLIQPITRAKSQPYPNYTPENNQQNQPYPPNYALPHYNPSFNPNNQAPQGTFPGGFMPQANGQQLGYPPQQLYPPQAQVYPPESTQNASGVNSQPLQYPPSSQPTLNQRAVETPSSPVEPAEPVKDSTKQSASPKQNE
ncbi:hypothetical protein CONCODRAFT_12275 [Conidiobolus coronatus NRRL 28638]|uniref:Uncharacterized protein n=1 Tax=Conidiobolus coronatus (strain ATCC 28846 / CBS 209.66 / NRRL 28638) TaxID=796925 RepID=A0A137NTG6_CONC2|nr:hypothetical protein CONCODRAFT_12275 [Conidiobolus coronatus NRRL 28638]|eukprot:KXN65988.1 hypothetical protein CONCODRAFT_12275 [Conidiobolus coronatus NRRL 28638]